MRFVGLVYDIVTGISHAEAGEEGEVKRRGRWSKEGCSRGWVEGGKGAERSHDPVGKDGLVRVSKICQEKNMLKLHVECLYRPVDPKASPSLSLSLSFSLSLFPISPFPLLPSSKRGDSHRYLVTDRDGAGVARCAGRIDSSDAPKSSIEPDNHTLICSGWRTLLNTRQN